MNHKQPVQFIVIKADGRVFIADKAAAKSGSWKSSIHHFVFDGNEAKETYHHLWFELSDVPKKVERKIPEKKTNVRYERIDAFSSVDHLPDVIPGDEWGCNDRYHGFEAMFEKKWDVTPQSLEEVDFEFVFFDENKGFMPPPNTSMEIKNGLLAQLIVPPVYQHLHDCRLTSPMFYAAIRAYVNDHIDMRYATVTSDYDFCFEVKKKVAFNAPKPYEIDLNAHKRTRRIKKITRFQEHELVTVFEMTHTNANQRGYSVLPDLVAGSHQELVDKLGEFLEKLIDAINEPVVMCHACNGTGIEHLEKNQTIEEWRRLGHLDQSR